MENSSANAWLLKHDDFFAADQGWLDEIIIFFFVSLEGSVQFTVDIDISWYLLIFKRFKTSLLNLNDFDLGLL